MADVRLLTVATVARRLRVARGTVHRLLRDRRMSGIRVGRCWRIEPEAVDAFVDRHRSIAQDDAPPPPDDRQLALFDGAAGDGPSVSGPPSADAPNRLTLDAADDADEEAALVDGLQTLGTRAGARDRAGDVTP